MSNICKLCGKEYNAILPNCPICASKEVVSNTDKLQEIKERWLKGLISTDAIEYLISQLEQAQGEVIQLGQVVNDYEYFLEKAQIEIQELKIQLSTANKLLDDVFTENEQLKQLNEEITKYINKLVKENEQLKADKQKLVEAIKGKISTLDKRIANMSKHEVVHCDHSERIGGLEGEAFIWEQALELVEQVLSEVKGNG